MRLSVVVFRSSAVSYIAPAVPNRHLASQCAAGKLLPFTMPSVPSLLMVMVELLEYSFRLFVFHLDHRHCRLYFL